MTYKKGQRLSIDLPMELKRNFKKICDKKYSTMTQRIKELIVQEINMYNNILKPTKRRSK